MSNVIAESVERAGRLLEMARRDEAGAVVATWTEWEPPFPIIASHSPHIFTWLAMDNGVSRRQLLLQLVDWVRDRKLALSFVFQLLGFVMIGRADIAFRALMVLQRDAKAADRAYVARTQRAS